MHSRVLAIIAFIGALAISACGGAPPENGNADVETNESALHDANGMWIGGPYHLTGTYSCQGDTWTMKGDFDQSYYSGAGGLYLSRIQPWFAVDSTRPELTVSSCIDANEGNQFYMLRWGADVLYNKTRKTCILYSHARGSTSWSLVSSNAAIEAGNIQYVKPGPTTGVQDRFQVTVSAYAGVGSPGVCSVMGAVFYFAAP